MVSSHQTFTSLTCATLARVSTRSLGKKNTTGSAATPKTRTELGIGCTGGVIGGLLGGGSGVFYVPALEKVATLSRPSLHGTAGAGNIAVTGVGAATFALAGGSIDFRAGIVLVLLAEDLAALPAVSDGIPPANRGE
ncbi:TSUP family transporter [Mycolicibacterium sarraceniae]|uniref:TSUP family transporter n=1 Tax=Mycolicibacterium sarraceniae TaxID=1534348 RepID=UPI001F477CC6